MSRLKAFLIITAVSLIPIRGMAMGFGKFCLFSEVQGVVHLDGAPVAGVEVERHHFWHWKDQRKREATITDDQGRFGFSRASGSSFMAGLLPHEPVVEQRILIRQQDQEYEAWIYAKHNYEEDGELQGRPLKLVCDLKSVPGYRETYGIHKAYGICTFE